MSTNVKQYLKSDTVSWYNPAEASDKKFGLIRPLHFAFRNSAWL